MKWYKETLSIENFQDVYDFTKQMEEVFNITIIFLGEDEDSSYWSGTRREIGLVIETTLQKLLSSLFHELGHCYCYDLYLHKKYHHSDDPEDSIKYGLKAEKFTDKIGKKLMKVYFPNIPYIKGYTAETIANFWYKQWVPFLKGEMRT